MTNIKIVYLSIIISLISIGVFHCRSNRPTPVTIWNAGARPGNFGFDFCQLALTGQADVLTRSMFSSGFRTALFLGASNTYNFANQANFVLNTNGGNDISNALAVDKSSTFELFNTTTGIKTENTTTIGDFLRLNISSTTWQSVYNTTTSSWDSIATSTSSDNGSFTSAALSIFSQIGLSSNATIWSFSDSNGNYVSGSSCRNSTTTEALTYGQYMTLPRINSPNPALCSTTLNVICIAK